MQRRPVKQYPGGTYPRRGEVFARMVRPAAVGLVVSAVAVSGCGGHMVGLVAADPLPVNCASADLELPAGELRELAFSSPEGVIRYRVRVDAADEAVAEAIELHAEEVLAACDATLLDHPLTTYQHVGADLPLVERELVRAVAAAAGVDVAQIRCLALLVEEYEETEDIPGGIGETGW